MKGISDHLKTQKMYKQAIHISSLYLIPDYLKTHDVCIKAFEEHSWHLSYVTLKQAMCGDTLRNKVPYQQQHVPDWFGTQEQVKRWYDDDNYCNNIEVVKS